MHSQELAGLLARMTAAAERADAEGFAACFTEDAVYHDYIYGPHAGRAEIARMLSGEKNLLRVFRERCFIYGESYAQYFVPMVVHRKLQAPTVSERMERVCRGFGLTQRWGSPVILKMIREGAG